MLYIENAPTPANKIADLREAVGWNRMEDCYKNVLMTSFFHISVYDGDKLIGYIDTVSNGVTDAYIQDLIVSPEYQGKGIGTELMSRTIAYLKERKIFMISVVFEEKLLPFYKRFGFFSMLCGQMQTCEMEQSWDAVSSAAWCDLTDNYKPACAELVGMIDSGERWIFEHSGRDNDFKGFICNKVLKTCSELGVLSACYYRNGLRISIAFDHDMPESAGKETAVLLQEIVNSTELNTFIWCRNENEKLRELISDTFKVQLNYASREMSVTKKEFQGWNTPALPQGFTLKGYDISRHEGYINLLEKAMSHVTPANTTPYLDRSDHLRERFVSLDKQNRFHALWYGEVLAGICFSDGGEIDTLALDVNYRKRGLGYYLLFSALQNAFLYRDGDICLYVVDHNPDAYEFYKRTGMKVTGHSARYFINRSVGGNL